MKKLLLFIVCLYYFPAFSETPDETAIKSLIAREKAAYFASDMVTWERCWAHEKYISSNSNEYSMLDQTVGWEAMSKKMRTALEQDPEPWAVTVHRENWSVHINGMMAYVTFNQKVVEDSTGVSYSSFETRGCEKKGAEWKIIHSGTLAKSPNIFALMWLIRGMGYAESKGETPETYAQAIFTWSTKFVQSQPRELGPFMDSMQDWCSIYQLDAEVLKSSDAFVQIRRTNFGNSRTLAGFFQSLENKGTAVERFYRAQWKLYAEAAGLIYEVSDDGDKTLETFRVK